jgi:uncharacterized protein (DUF2141 family)
VEVTIMPATFRTFALLLSTLTFSAIAAGAQPAEPTNIHVDITGLISDKGQVQCALFASTEGFPKNSSKAVAHTSSSISNRHASCDFANVAPGNYAISVFHDENANGKLDSNFIGMPREGVGASNNVKPHFGPPKFKDASFPCTGGQLNLRITIIYL